MCKDRIEAAAKVEGVTKADWNKDTVIDLVYNPAMVKSDDIQKKSLPWAMIQRNLKQRMRLMPNYLVCKYDRKK